MPLGCLAKEAALESKVKLRGQAAGGEQGGERQTVGGEGPEGAWAPSHLQTGSGPGLAAVIHFK